MNTIKILILSVLAVGVLSMLILSCQVTPTIKKEMVRLDEAVVPMWSAIQDGDLAKAERASILFKYRWEQFKNEYGDLHKKNDDWIEFFRMVDDWLCDMTISLQTNNVANAASQIDHIIYEEMAFRKRNNILYYLDHLWNFENAFTIVNTTVNDPMIDLLEWCELESQVELMNEQWMLAYTNKPDYNTLEWQDTKIVAYQSQFSKLEKSLAAFNKTMHCADQHALIDVSIKVQNDMMQMISFFGDSAASNIYFVNN